MSSREGGNLRRPAIRQRPETPAFAGAHEPETLHPARTPGYFDGCPKISPTSCVPAKAGTAVGLAQTPIEKSHIASATGPRD